MALLDPLATPMVLLAVVLEPRSPRKQPFRRILSLQLDIVELRSWV